MFMQNFKEIAASVLPLVGLFALFYFFIIRPQRVQQKKHKEMLSNLQKGDKIVTQGGFICEVIKPEDTFFSVKLNDDTIVKLAKEYVSYKLDDTTK